MQEFQYRMLEDETFAVTGYSGEEKEVIIPDTHWGKPVTVLFDGLFSGHSEIESVLIPDTVTDIGEFVFDGCRNLRQIRLPAGLEHIWPYAFARCGIEEIILPEKIHSIAPFTFKDCRNLKKVSAGPKLKNVYGYAFGGCDSLAEFFFSPGTILSPLAFESRKDRSEGKMTLELFKYDTCPYCRRVMDYVKSAGRTDVLYRDIRKSPEEAERLLSVGGKMQVPCLFIDGEPLYESMDIIKWLEEHPEYA